MTGMFAMIFGIVYVRSRENLAMIEKGLNPKNKDIRPQPFVNLKWGLLLIGAGLGLLFAYIIDNTVIKHDKTISQHRIITIKGDHHNANKAKVTIVADTNNTVKDTSLIAHSTPATKDDDGDDSDDLVIHGGGNSDNPALYFALIAIGGGLGLFFSYRIEKKEWLDKKIDA